MKVEDEQVLNGLIRSFRNNKIPSTLYPDNMKETRQQELTIYSEMINQECLWEYNFSGPEIVQLAQHGNDQEKMFLFNKIMENATDILKSMNIFSLRDQREMLLNFHLPEFKHNFLERRYKILKYFIANQRVDIPELRWNK